VSDLERLLNGRAGWKRDRGKWGIKLGFIERISGDSGGGPLRRAREGQCHGLRPVLLLAFVEPAEEGD
jgi:hypothetical protein